MASSPKVLNLTEHLSLSAQDNIRNPLQFIGGRLRRYRRRAKDSEVTFSTNIIDDMIKSISRAELAVNKEK